MHLCWSSLSGSTYTPYERVNFSDGSAFTVTLSDVVAYNQALPKILEFSHPLHSTISADETFWFSFANATHGHPNIVPSHNPYDSSELGMIEVVDILFVDLVLLTQTLTHANSEPNQGAVQCQKSGEQAGKCFINGLTLLPGSVIGIKFYSNSFSYTDGTNRYYLFGDHPNVSMMYMHELFVVDSLITPSEDTIEPDDRLMLNVQLNSLDNQAYDSLKYPYWFGLFYKSIFLSLNVVGQTWETPTATVNLKNIIDKSLYITNLDLKNCTSGELMANAVITVENYYYSFEIEQNGIQLGTLNCSKTWDTCTTAPGSDWDLCSDDYPYYSLVYGKWQKDCIYSYAFSTNYVFDDSGNKYTRLTWSPNWPFSYYSDRTFKCNKWFSECVKCEGNKPEDCTLWNFPYPFLLGSSWVSECPEELYNTDYINYEWVPNDYYDATIVDSTVQCQTTSLYSKNNLSVDIILTGVSSTVMISAGGTLVMNIENKRGNIISYKFTQVTPTPDPNDELTNVFPLITGTTNQYLNETQSVNLNPEAIENYAEGTLFKVMAEVENDWGDKAIDYITFVLNPKPTVGTASITCSSSPWAVLEDITITLTGSWYSENSYEMELYIKVSLELADGTTVLLAPETWEQTAFTFILPVVSTVNETVSTSLLITAINIHDNTSTLYKSLTIDNTLPDGYESSLFSPAIDITDMNSLTLLSSQMMLLLKAPKSILIGDGKVWTRDSDWSNHGLWIGNGLAWQWDDTYTGIDCSVHYQMYSSLASIVESSVEYLFSELVAHSYSTRSVIQMYFEIITGLLVRPELISLEYALSFVYICEEMASLSDSVLLALPTEFDQIFLQFVSHYYIKVIYDVNVNMMHYNETEFTATSSLYNSFKDKQSNIQIDSEAVWIATEKYFIRVSSKANHENTFVKYSTDIGSFKIEYKIANTLNGTTYTVDSDKDYKIAFPTDLFDGSTQIDLSGSVRVLAISWHINPIILSNKDAYKIVSDTLSVHLIDVDRELITISNKNITLSMPLSYEGNSNLTDLSCKAWSLVIKNSSLSDSE